MKHLGRLFLVFFIILTYRVEAQNVLEKTDSIYRYAQAHPTDSTSLYDLNTKLISIYIDNSDTAIYYAKNQLLMARRSGWRNLEAMSLILIGLSHEISGNLDTSINYYQDARIIGNLTRDTAVLVTAYNSLGRVYSLKGLYELSIEETLKAVELIEVNKNPRRNASILNSVGLRFNELNRRKQAIGFLRQALAINESIQDTFQIVINATNLGKTYHAAGIRDSSMFFNQKALKLSNRIKNRYQSMLAYSGLSVNYLDKEVLDSAQWCKDSALDIAHKIKDAYRIHEADLIQGKIYLSTGNYRQAIVYFEEALNWFKDADYVSKTIEILESLAQAYDLTDDHEQSLIYMKQLAELKDRVYLEQRNRAMAQVDIYRQQRQEKETSLLNQQIDHQTGLRNLFILLGLLMMVLLAVGLNRYLFERKTKKLLAEKNAMIEFQKDRSEQLLLNILPSEVAEELKEHGKSDARHFEKVTVLFTDFVSFTDISAKLTPKELVEEIDHCFKAFDEIMTRYKVEKIKTIGDAYMAAGGLQEQGEVAVKDVVLAALEMQEFMENYAEELRNKGRKAFQMRVGIHTGPVVAGIVGHKKFQYDIWGDTVNTASRMESHGDAGKVNLSHRTYEMLKDAPGLAFESRGALPVKGKGEMEMWFVTKTNN